MKKSSTPFAIFIGLFVCGVGGVLILTTKKPTPVTPPPVLLDGAVLFDIEVPSSASPSAKAKATPEDFKKSGVTEASESMKVLTALASGTKPMTAEGVTLSYKTQNKAGMAIHRDRFTENALLNTQIFLNRDNPVADGPVEMRISGLNEKLQPNTDYRLYLFGTGSMVNPAKKEISCGATFTFASKSIAISDAPPDDGTIKRAATFNFTTGEAGSFDSLDFTWARNSEAVYSAFNGFAIVPAN